MNIHRIRLLVPLIALIVLIGACCGGSQNKRIKIGYSNWADGIALTYLVKNILTDRGYNVQLLNADPAPIYTSMSRKKIDVFMDMWLPVTHKDYFDLYGDDFELLGVSYDDARIGLVVPDYVTIESIEELNANKDRFDSKIVGIDAGSGIMAVTEQAIIDYNLDFELLTASGPTMTATLKKAIDENKWVVVTGWTPHWKFQRYPLKMLKDPKGVYGSAEQLYSVAWKGFSEKDPFAAELISNIKLSTEEIGSLMADLEDSRTTEDRTIREWMDRHPELIESWIPKKKDQQE